MRPNQIFLLVAAATFLCRVGVEPATAQPFTDIGADLVEVYNCSLAWGDYDNDGDLDLALAGVGASSPVSKIYRNDEGEFVVISANLVGVTQCSLAWGDYDNDGDLDLALAGNDCAEVYHNDAGTFNNIDADLIGVNECALAWGDYDNDGDLDLVVAGDTGNAAVTKLYRNNAGAFADAEAGLIGVSQCALAWGDYDNDGDLDLVLAGDTGTAAVSKIYRNDAGTFADTGATLPDAENSSLAWGDYDNDGDLDLILARGKPGSGYVCTLFDNSAGMLIPGLGMGSYEALSSVAWGDYDNDGDLDLAMAVGFTGTPGHSKLYRNDVGTFTEIDAGLTGVHFGSLAWGDYDNDGDLDLALAGWLDEDLSCVSRIYRNNGGMLNAIPSAPASLLATASGRDVTFSWNAASDDHTPANGLSYNLRVGSTPDDDDIFGGMADLTAGWRRLPGMGNVQKRRSWTLHDLCGTVYWSVQGVDTALAGGSWAPREYVAVPLPGDIDLNCEVEMNDLPLFVAVLLGADTDPAHVTAADVNGSGTVDGLDIEPFLAVLLGSLPAGGSVHLKAATCAVAENAGHVRLYVSRTGGASGVASVSYSTSDGSATAEADYELTKASLIWEDGDVADKIFDVLLHDDGVYEGDETFKVQLSMASGASLGDPSKTVVTIIDDDAPPAGGSLQFKAAAYAVAENGGSVRIYVRRTGGAYGAASVNYTTCDDSALAGADYDATSGPLNWPDGDAADRYFDVPILDDGTYESDETFTVGLSVASGASLGDPSTTTVTIIDNENPPPSGTLQFKAATYAMAENGGSVRVYVSRTGGSYGAASANYATANGSATAGADYAEASGTLNWPDGDATDQYFDVLILDDGAYEGDESFTVELSGASGASLGDPGTTTVTIIDNESPPPSGSLQFKAATYAMAENGGSVRVYVSRTGGSYGAAGVNYATSDGSAMAGTDYAETSGSLNWPDGDAADKYFDVLILDDGAYEGDESFTVGLSGASLGSPTTTTVTIIDNESPPPSGSLQIKDTAYTVAENGGSVRIFVSRAGGSYGAASANYATADGSATAGSDYAGTSGTLNWPDGDASDRYFDVLILDDGVFEGDETFTAGLDGISGASPGSPIAATVTIADDESPPPSGMLQFEAASYTMAENGGSIRIYVSRTGGAYGAAGVNYATANGSATAGKDYAAASGTLTWPDGDAADRYFDVTVLDDVIYEGDETFTINLSGSSGASLGSPTTTTVTIIENESPPPSGSLRFMTAAGTVAENGGSAHIYVSRTGGAFGAASVSYATVNQSATGGADYSATSGTLNWSDGDAANKHIAVAIINDSVYEGAETFQVVLSGASGAALGSPAVTAISITDDENAVVWYRDSDGDGFGNPNDSVHAASQPPGFVSNSADCNDGNAGAHPGAPEVCGNGIDEDCDGQDRPCVSTWFRDADGDGFGDPGKPIQSSAQLSGYVRDSTDCNDNDATLHDNCDASVPLTNPATCGACGVGAAGGMPFMVAGVCLMKRRARQRAG